MTKRAEQFLEALPRATQRFVHIEVELLREVLALVREPLQEQLRCAEAERDSSRYALDQLKDDLRLNLDAVYDLRAKNKALVNAAERYISESNIAAFMAALNALEAAIAEARKV